MRCLSGRLVIVLSLLIVVSTSLHGCSFLFSKSAPRFDVWDEPQARFADCTSHYLYPVLDGLYALGQFGAARGPDKNVILAWGLLGVVSAVHGVMSARRCNEFLDVQEIMHGRLLLLDNEFAFKLRETSLLQQSLRLNLRFWPGRLTRQNVVGVHPPNELD